jgi:Uma2 family endonuclease
VVRFGCQLHHPQQKERSKPGKIRTIPVATQANHFITLEEYLMLEQLAEERHEYYNGEMFAMAGGSPEHADIAANLVREIGNKLKKGCRVRGSDMGIKTPTGLHTYADAVISCDPQQYDHNFLVNPLVIFEVLSDSTEARDRGKKFETYRTIPSFCEYFLIAQDRMYVERYLRSSRDWTMREFKADDLLIETVNLTLPLSLIYANVPL